MTDNTQEREAALHKESVRCMSIVFDEIAAMLELPKEQYGDPDALMEAIAKLKDAASAQPAPAGNVVERAKNGLNTLALAAPPSNEVMQAVRDIRAALATDRLTTASEVFDRAIDPVGEHGNNATIPCTAGVASSTSDPALPTPSIGEDEAVKRVARALCAAAGHDPDGPTCDVHIEGDPDAIYPWAGYRKQARAALLAAGVIGGEA